MVRRLNSVECSSRLQLLVDYLLESTGWTKAQLADHLGRTRGNLVPGSGLPRLDYLVRMSQLLGWNVERLADWIVDGGSEHDARRVLSSAAGTPPDSIASDATTFVDLDSIVFARSMAADLDNLWPLTRRLHELASTPTQRAIATIRELNLHTADGWFDRGIACTRIVQRIGPPTTLYRMSLIVNSGACHLGLDNLLEAEALAATVQSWYGDDGARTHGDRGVLAFAHFVRGEALRRGVWSESSAARREDRAATAALHLSAAEALFAELAAAHGYYVYEDMRRTAQATREACHVLAGVRAAEAALTVIASHLADDEAGDYESTGWFAAIGAELLRRQHRDAALPERVRETILRYGSRIDAIAAAHRNWELRRIALTLQVQHEPAPRLDPGALMGTMSRFPRFRAIGSMLLRRAALATA